MKNQQSELIKSFNALKEMYNIEFVEEENLFTLLNQLSETIFSKAHYETSSDYQNYLNFQIKQNLESERIKAINNITLFRGSLL